LYLIIVWIIRYSSISLVVHLVHAMLSSNHRSNHFQIRLQSSHFMRGFQQLIKKEWIDMFNEHELQVFSPRFLWTNHASFAWDGYLALLISYLTSIEKLYTKESSALCVNLKISPNPLFPPLFDVATICLQLLISGSLDSLDIDDLRSHTNYAGGYHSVS
jgi:hypothetical protein